MIFILAALWLWRPGTSAALLLPVLREDAEAEMLSGSSSSTTTSDQRTIFEIVWPCLATICLCSWVSIHPNVPPPNENWLKTNVRKLECMFWTILAPELVILWAARQWYGARKIADKYRERGWGQVHGHFLQMGGFMLYNGRQAQRTLSHRLLEALLLEGVIDFPDITEDEIQDRSKSDGLAKFLVICQTAWFILQVIARKTQNLKITEIELATLGFASLNLLMYTFWWNKPINVNVAAPVLLLVPRQSPDLLNSSWGSSQSISESFASIISEDQSEGSESVSLFEFILRFILLPLTLFSFMKRRLYQITRNEETKEMTSISTRPSLLSVPTFYAIRIDVDRYLEFEALLVCLTGAIFGGIHCAGWFLHFPTFIELWIWRISALVIVGFPSILLLSIQLFPTLENLFHHSEAIYFISDAASSILAFIGLPLYVIARFALVAEAFSTLRDLPKGAYANVQWTSFIPHI